uniref:SCAN box domain-containing protein n=1 Tax=Crocodylus porosus TaxID=8502 RepID=A0A7M4EE19_CROPO
MGPPCIYSSGVVPPEDSSPPLVVPSEILHWPEITPEKHHQAFRAKKAGERKSPRVLWQCLVDLLNKWLRPELLSKEQVYEQILLEQFINDLEEDTQRWVKCHCPTSSREALQLAEQFDTAQGGRRQVRTAKGTEVLVNKNIDFKMDFLSRCGEEGHRVPGVEGQATRPLSNVLRGGKCPGVTWTRGPRKAPLARTQGADPGSDPGRGAVGPEASGEQRGGSTLPSAEQRSPSCWHGPQPPAREQRGGYILPSAEQWVRSCRRGHQPPTRERRSGYAPPSVEPGRSGAAVR